MRAREKDAKLWRKVSTLAQASQGQAEKETLLARLTVPIDVSLHHFFDIVGRIFSCE